MARLQRIAPLGIPQPIIQRGNNRQVFFACDEELIKDIRSAVNKGMALGGDRFKEEIEQLANRRVRPAKMDKPRLQSEVKYVSSDPLNYHLIP